MRLFLSIIFVLTSSVIADSKTPVNPDVLSVVQKAGITGAVQSTCTAHFFSPDTSAIVVAVDMSNDKGAYFVLHGASAQVLGTYSAAGGIGDIQCVSSRDIASMNSSIEESEDAGIYGHIEQNDGLDVVCGFVDDTEAVCWGYDKKINRVVTKGGWTT